MESAGKSLSITPDRVFVNLQHYGNTSSAPIPIVLDEACRTGRLRERDLVLLDAFGGGLSWAAALLRS